MTHRKITVKVNQKSRAAGEDFAARADRLIQESWHLPPDGDQSWRDQDARRIFSEHGEEEINQKDQPSVQEGCPQPGFRAPRRHFLLPLSLGTGLAAAGVCFAILPAAPDMLTASFRNMSEPTPNVAVAPLSVANAASLGSAAHAPDAAPGKLRPSLAYNANFGQTPKPNDQTVKPAPHARFARTTDTSAKPAIRTAKERPRRPRTLAEKLDAAFAAMPPRQFVATNETGSADWKAEAAKWDKMANEIRARNGKRETDSNSAATESGGKDASEFP